MGFYDYPPGDVSHFIESWILATEEYTPLKRSAGVEMATPSPTKRARRGYDVDATPRAIGAAGEVKKVAVVVKWLMCVGASLTLRSEEDDASTTTTSSRRSGSVSPKKRELELRQAREWPLERRDVTMCRNPTALMRDVAALRSARLIPASVKVSALLNPPPLYP